MPHEACGYLPNRSGSAPSPAASADDERSQEDPERVHEGPGVGLVPVVLANDEHVAGRLPENTFDEGSGLCIGLGPIAAPHDDDVRLERSSRCRDCLGGLAWRFREEGGDVTWNEMLSCTILRGYAGRVDAEHRERRP